MSELLRGTEQRQRRVLVGTGAVVVAIAILATLVITMLPERRSAATIEIVVMTPTIGQGIDSQSKVVLHGMPVGTIAAVERYGEAAEMRLRLDRNSVRGLTDGFGFDFRPANAWGLSALNLLPRGAGYPLVDGQRINRAPVINATLSQMMSGQMTFVDKVITEKFAQLIRNSSDYTTALLPFIESGLILMNLVADTAQETSTPVLQELNSLITPMPDVIDVMLTSIHNFRHQKGGDLLINDYSVMEETVGVITPDLAKIGAEIIRNHRTELVPGTEVARALLDSFSMIAERSRGSLRMDKVLAGLQDGYFGPDDKTTQWRLVLEQLPALESSMPVLPNSGGTGGR